MPPEEGNPFTLRTPERHSGRQGTANHDWNGKIRSMRQIIAHDRKADARSL